MQTYFAYIKEYILGIPKAYLHAYIMIFSAYLPGSTNMYRYQFNVVNHRLRIINK